MVSLRHKQLHGMRIESSEPGPGTDSIAAIACGLAGLYYSIDAIPADWLDVIARKDWITKLFQSF